MSIDPVWQFFRVAPDEVTQVQEAFDRAVRQSQITDKANAFFQRQTAKVSDFDDLDDLDEFDNFASVYYDEAFDLFYPEAFTSFYDDITTKKLVLSEQSSACTLLEFVITNRVGATVMLAYALGWERMSRLPGYFGNLFVPPDAVAAVLADVETIFAEVPAVEFIQRADTAGSLGNCNEEVAFNLPTLLPSALCTVLAEGNGLLALNYPDAGSIPYPGYEDDEYEG